jgi:hypothetical protein
MTQIAIVVFSLLNTSLRMVENAGSRRRFTPRLCVIVSNYSAVVWIYTCVQKKLFVELIRRTACARAQFSGCSSTTNVHSETGQMAVVKTCSQVRSVALARPLCYLARYLKSSVFFWTRGDSGKCDKRTAHHHRKCVPGSIPTMEETLGTVYRQ